MNGGNMEASRNGASRNRVLIIGDSRPGTTGFRDKLAELGWPASVVDECSEAHINELAKTAASGVVIFNDDSIANLDSIEKALSRSPIEWIAILPKSVLAITGVKKTLSKLFYAFHTHPIHFSHIDCLLTHACAIHELQQEGNRDSYARDIEKFNMVGKSPEMEKTFNTIQRVAAVDAPVFISGESGTGKELAARSIHDMSRRAKGPFIAVNCGALPSELIQSELFGHEKGSFTSANQKKIGRLESASGGTLLLDEIGDLPLDMQVNLLRFLEDHKIQRVGGIEEIPVDVRILAATHVDLEKAVEEGRFREDLYHRLNVLQVRVPSLRERQEDIETLANFFFDKFFEEKSSRVRGFSKESLARMQRYAWPGNIRELINRVRRAMVMCEGRLIKPEDLGLERRCSYRQPVTLEEARDLAESEVIKAALARNQNNIQRAAKELSVSRVTLYRLIEKHDITRKAEHNGSREEGLPPAPIMPHVSMM
jgi:DNA-binding NtrC family response regulator